MGSREENLGKSNRGLRGNVSGLQRFQVEEGQVKLSSRVGALPFSIASSMPQTPTEVELLPHLDSLRASLLPMAAKLTGSSPRTHGSQRRALSTCPLSGMASLFRLESHQPVHRRGACWYTVAEPVGAGVAIHINLRARTVYGNRRAGPRRSDVASRARGQFRAGAS